LFKLIIVNNKLTIWGGGGLSNTPKVQNLSRPFPRDPDNAGKSGQLCLRAESREAVD
jgi:hypothetical protein